LKEGEREGRKEEKNEWKGERKEKKEEREGKLFASEYCHRLIILGIGVSFIHNMLSINNKIDQQWWHISVIPASQKTETVGLWFQPRHG
jgi:hypothetical protein